MKGMYPRNGRVILHVDANSYYASVEAAYDPSLKSKPLAIAGNPNERKGIIITCNYIARQYGIYTTMPLWEAKRKCPGLIIRKPNFELYREMSARMFEFLSVFSPVLEHVSIDEGYLDISNSYKLGSPLEIAEKIQQGLLKNLDIPVSVGIAPNKFLAKTASDLKKPLGITVLRKREIKTVLWNKRVEEMHGIGRKTAEKLNDINIITIGDLAQSNLMMLKRLLGVNGLYLKERANGIDERPVNPHAVFECKTIGNSSTLPNNVSEERDILEVFQRLSQSVSERMKRKKVVSQNIQITIRYSNFKTINRSRKLPTTVCESADIFKNASQLFKKHWDGEAVRLVGVTALDIIDRKSSVEQLDLFTFEETAKQEPLFQVINKLKQKFGDKAIQTGADLMPGKPLKYNDSFTSGK